MNYVVNEKGEKVGVLLTMSEYDFLTKKIKGSGDYTKERHQLLKSQTVDQLTEEIFQLQKEDV